MDKTAPPLIVTIDGPAGVGKSTLARQLASTLGIAYLDTGAMFRTIAFHLGEKGLTLSVPELEKHLHTLTFSLSGTGKSTVLACNGIHAGQEIRSESIGMLAAKFAALPVIRTYLKNAQKNLGEKFSLVAEGRDMGSEVFPQAPCKFFLDASPEVRAQRRFDQLSLAGETPDIATLTEQIRQRDDLDRNRTAAPLRPAPDAHIIDTSNIGITDVLRRMTDICA